MCYGYNMSQSLSSRALDELLNEGGDAADAVKGSGIHRTLLHRYRTGKGKPDAETVAKLDRVSGGRVPANGWEDTADETQGAA